MRAVRMSDVDRAENITLQLNGRQATGGLGHPVRAGDWIRPGQAAVLRLRLRAGAAYWFFRVGVAQRDVVSFTDLVRFGAHI